MRPAEAAWSTGLPGLDRILCGVLPGDNLVWQVDSIEEYLPLVEPFAAATLREGRRLTYFRFARHEPLLPPSPALETLPLRPEEGFESFLSEIHRAIEQRGEGGGYLFDSLSDLAADWYSDSMLGNFFMLTCPYLYDVRAVAYFAILRGRHSPDATTPIGETAQIVGNVHRHKGRLYVHPLKVQQRHSPTMYMLHAWEDGEFRPVTDSATITEIMGSSPWSGLDAAGRGRGVWDRAFREAAEAADAIRRGERAREEASDLLERLLRMAVTRDDRFLSLCRRFLRLEDLVEIRRRMIGTGLIGGKAAGMLLARAVLRERDPAGAEAMEPHDSFYVGSDVYYTYVVRNGVWWIRQKQRAPETFLQGAEEARQRLLTGTFPEGLRNQFADMLDYFGQSPIIVRSSSLLEDAFGNAFAGKYESIFLANQGPRQNRLEDFLSAVRAIYASTMGERALSYRARRGLLGRDEQMALLVQRVSGRRYGSLFFPQAAGVALSYNPYAWNEIIRPEAGVVRLVFGLGTRAVNRSDDDYTRVASLNAPERRPETSLAEIRQYAQRRVDVLDLEANRVVSLEFSDIVRRKPDLPLEVFASRDREAAAALPPGGDDAAAWVLTFDRLLTRTPLAPSLRRMLKIIEAAYGVPVDTEFTLNLLPDGTPRIHLLQCRPLQVRSGGPAAAEIPPNLPPEEILLEARGAVIGHSRDVPVHRILYVVPSAYGRLPLADRYSVARLVGRLARLPRPADAGILFLLGPGRWGTSTPSLGVPVDFSEISGAGAIGEIVAMREDLVPDVSLGTHYFNDLVEQDVLYCALFPEREGNSLNETLLGSAPNRLTDLMPQEARWSEVIRVMDANTFPGGGTIRLFADSLRSRAVCLRRRP